MGSVELSKPSKEEQKAPKERYIPSFSICRRIRHIICKSQLDNTVSPSDLDELVTLVKRAKSALNGFDSTAARNFTILLCHALFVFVRFGEGESVDVFLASVDREMATVLSLSPETVLLPALIEPVMLSTAAKENLIKVVKHFNWSSSHISLLKDHFPEPIFGFIAAVCTNCDC